MPTYTIHRPKPDVIRVQFPPEWNAEAESQQMFGEVLKALDEAEGPVTLMIVAGAARPVYSTGGLHAAQDILYHENINRMIIVADDPRPATIHMAGIRGERALPAIPILGYRSEAEAEQYLSE